MPHGIGEVASVVSVVFLFNSDSFPIILAKLKKTHAERTDGQTNGWTDGWAYRQMDGRTNGCTDGQMDGWMDIPSYKDA